jgi:hypothetical protein
MTFKTFKNEDIKKRLKTKKMEVLLFKYIYIYISMQHLHFNYYIYNIIQYQWINF